MLSRMQTQRQTSARNWTIISTFASVLTLVSLFSYCYSVDYRLPNLFVQWSAICTVFCFFTAALSLAVAWTKSN